jgi:putative PIN family toxin of toxin-antitoxin system
MPIKIVIDSNLWISFLIGKKLKSLRNLCLNKNISVFYCDEIIEEFIDVSNRAKIKKLGIRKSNVSVVLKFIRTHCTKAEIKGVAESKVRDAKDLYLLSFSDAVNANFLLTGDKGLQSLERHNITKIVSYSEFMSMLDDLGNS